MCGNLNGKPLSLPAYLTCADIISIHSFRQISLMVGQGWELVSILVHS